MMRWIIGMMVVVGLMVGGCSGVKIVERYDKAGPDATSTSQGQRQVVRKYVDRKTGRTFFMIVDVEGTKEVAK
jgi:uncharacterized lipoprotein YmbA